MKRRREIILDFTALLDIIMIILFFFILFSHFEAVEAKKKMENAQSTADAQIADAELRKREAEKLIAEATAAEKKALDAYNRLAGEGERSTQNYDALKAFEDGSHLRLYLTGTAGAWNVLFMQGGVSEIAPIGDDLAAAFQTTFETLGYTSNSTILCEFTFDGEARNSRNAYYLVHDIINGMRKQYPYLYISEFDESKRREAE